MWRVQDISRAALYRWDLKENAEELYSDSALKAKTRSAQCWVPTKVGTVPRGGKPMWIAHLLVTGDWEVRIWQNGKPPPYQRKSWHKEIKFPGDALNPSPGTTMNISQIKLSSLPASCTLWGFFIPCSSGQTQGWAGLGCVLGSRSHSGVLHLELPRSTVSGRGAVGLTWPSALQRALMQEVVNSLIVPRGSHSLCLGHRELGTHPGLPAASTHQEGLREGEPTSASWAEPETKSEFLNSQYNVVSSKAVSFMFPEEKHLLLGLCFKLLNILCTFCSEIRIIQSRTESVLISANGGRNLQLSSNFQAYFVSIKSSCCHHTCQLHHCCVPTANNDRSLVSLGLPNINSLCSVVIMFTNPSLITLQSWQKKAHSRGLWMGFYGKCLFVKLLPVETKEILEKSIHKNFFGSSLGPSQISTKSEFGLSDRTNWRDPPQSRNALLTLCFQGNDGPLLSLD